MSLYADTCLLIQLNAQEFLTFDARQKSLAVALGMMAFIWSWRRPTRTWWRGWRGYKEKEIGGRLHLGTARNASARLHAAMRRQTAAASAHGHLPM